MSFVHARIGRVPSAGDAVEIGHYRFEVVDIDGLRVGNVLIIPLKPLER
jgi:CBS domain containing-hemolysin-like protein